MRLFFLIIEEICLQCLFTQSVFSLHNFKIFMYSILHAFRVFWEEEYTNIFKKENANIAIDKDIQFVDLTTCFFLEEETL